MYVDFARTTKHPIRCSFSTYSEQSLVLVSRGVLHGGGVAVGLFRARERERSELGDGESVSVLV